MKRQQTNEFDNILDECLERMVKGDTIEQCLADYPEHALELEPLLMTVRMAREAAEVQPRPDFKARARYEFRAALHDEMAPDRAKSPFSLKRGWVSALMVISILFVAGGGTALAANDSMPDSPLYNVKLASEQVQLTLTPSSIGKAELCTAFAERRVDEIVYIAANGDAQQIEMVTEHLGEDLMTLAMVVTAPGSESAASGPAMSEIAPRQNGDSAMLSVPTTPSAPPPSSTAPAPTEPGNASKPQHTDTYITGGEDDVPAPMVEVPSDILPDDGDTESDSSGNNDRANLKKTVIDMAETHQEVLSNLLMNSPEAVKDAIAQAIEVSQNGYRNAINNLN